MATRIRLARGGSKKRPFYRLVVTDKRSPRDGSFIEKIGTYNPLLDDKNENRFTFNKERVEYWLKTGASPSEKVAIFLYNNGFKTVERYLPTQYPKSAKEREAIKKKKLDEENKKKAEQEAKIKAEQEETAKKEAEAKAGQEEAEAKTEQEAPTEKAEEKAEAK